MKKLSKRSANYPRNNREKRLERLWHVLRSWFVDDKENVPPEDLRVDLYINIPYDAGNETQRLKVSEIAVALRNLLDEVIGPCEVDDNVEVTDAKTRNVKERVMQYRLW